jgi:hypothetical protein
MAAVCIRDSTVWQVFDYPYYTGGGIKITSIAIIMCKYTQWENTSHH